MRKINETNPNEKRVLAANQNPFDTNQIEYLAGNSNGLSVFDYAENNDKKQCNLCNPPISRPRGATELCANCEAEQKQSATNFFDNFRRHRKVIKLDRYCFACATPKSEARMSKIVPICRICAGELQAKGATAQNNFIARAVNNFHKKLKAVTI